MTPANILITVCLALAPLFVGLLIGRTLGLLYEWKNDWIGMRRHAFFYNFYLESEQVQRRMAFILLFWAILGGVAGGFLAGSYLESVFMWWIKFMVNVGLHF